MAKKTRKVEYLRAFDDNTWDTFVEEVAMEFDAEDAIPTLIGQAQHRRAVLIAVYCDPFEPEDIGGEDD